MKKKTKKIMKISGISLGIIILLFGIYFFYSKIATGDIVTFNEEVKTNFNGLNVTVIGDWIDSNGHSYDWKMGSETITATVGANRDSHSRINMQIIFPEKLESMEFQLRYNVGIGSGGNTALTALVDNNPIVSYSDYRSNAHEPGTGTSRYIRFTEINNDWFALIGEDQILISNDDIAGKNFTVVIEANSEIGNTVGSLTLSQWNIEYESGYIPDIDTNSSKTPYFIGGGTIGLLGILGFIFRKKLF